MLREKLSKIKGKNKIEMYENIATIITWIFAFLIAFGIMLSVFNKSLAFYLVSFSSFGIFISLSFLIIVILIKEIKYGRK